jgi:hypothetical protein
LSLKKDGECVAVGHHKDVGKAIEEWEKAFLSLNTYTAAQTRPGLEIIHYLLFERGA